MLPDFARSFAKECNGSKPTEGCMRQLLFLLRKEFQQLRRDPAMMRVLLVAPLVQMLVLSYAINTDLKEMKAVMVDLDRTQASSQFIAKFFGTDYFQRVHPEVGTFSEATTLLEHGKADLIVTIPRGFAADKLKNAQIGLTVDGQNSNVAGLGSGYAARLIADMNLTQMKEWKRQGRLPEGTDVQIRPVVRFWFNPELESKHFMVPGIVVMLISTVSGMLAGIAIVKEKEIGTIELLLVAPLERWQLVAGKLLPFFILSFGAMSLALAIGMIWFGVPFSGSSLTLIGGVSLYLVVMLSVGLLVSTMSATQMQAMFSVWFVLIFGIMTSGFFFPIENMPKWLQYITIPNPMRYMMEIMRSVLIKGSSLVDLKQQFAMLTGLGAIVFALAVTRFQKQLG